MPFQGRRQAQRRGAVQQYPTVPTVGYVTVTSATPPSLGPSDTFQVTVRVESPEIPTTGAGLARVVLTDRTVTWSIPTATVATVTVTPAPSAVAIAGTVVLSAVVRDSVPNILTGRTVTWGSDDTNVATVGADSGTDAHTATVTGVGSGSCTITATCETVTGTSTTTAASVSTDGYAELPRATVDTTYALPGGTVKTVKTSGGDYTAAQFATALAWAAAEVSAVLVIDDALLITGEYTVPGRTGAGWVYVMSASVYADTFPRAEGVRVLEADSGAMAYLRTTVTNQSVLKFLPSATPPRRYRFIGLRIDATTNTSELVSLSSTTATVADVPEYIIFDRCDIFGVPGTYNVRRALRLDGRHVAAVGCRLRGCRDASNSDSQGIWLNDAPGPVKIDDCFLEAASENLMAGGAPTGRTPSDITITGSHFYKPLAWNGVYPVKNLLELKFAQRVLVDGNIFENNWASGQTGFAILLKSTSQLGTGDGVQYVTRDVTFRNNKVLNSVNWINLAVTTEDSHQPLRNLTFRNNLFGTRKDGAGSVARSYILGSNADGAVDGITFVNNTLDGYHGYYANLLDPGAAFSGSKATNFVMTDNVISGGEYGPFGASGTTMGYGNVTALYTTPVCTRNGFISGPTGAILASYPAGNVFVAVANLAAQFVDRANADYTLAGGSTFKGIGLGGADPGMDPTTLNAAVSGVKDN